MVGKAILSICLIAGAASTTLAQRGVDDGSIFGRGKDSVDCLLNVSLANKYVRQKEYRKAYLPWKEAITSCPKSQITLYNDGVKILHALLLDKEDSLRHPRYLQELCDLYDKNILYKDELNRQMLHNPIQEPAIRAIKAYDYFHYAGNNLDLRHAHSLVREAVNQSEQIPPYLLEIWMQLDLQMYQGDHSCDTLFVHDYAKALASCLRSIRRASRQEVSQWESCRKAIGLSFKRSGLNTYESISHWYNSLWPEVRGADDTQFQLLCILKELGMDNKPLYAEALAGGSNSTDTDILLECARAFYKQGNANKGLTCYKKALATNRDSSRVSDIAYEIATICLRNQNLLEAKNYIKRSIEANRHNGMAYVLQAQIYAAAPYWSDDSIMNRCTYFLAIDKLQQAKLMDSNVKEEANRLISQYVQRTPTASELHFLKIKKGDVVKIGGWIDESVTIK